MGDDALGIERAHLVGASMGGMVAQLAAATHPERVLSVTSIMSSTNSPFLPPPKPAALKTLVAPRVKITDLRSGAFTNSAIRSRAPSYFSVDRSLNVWMPR